MPAYGAAGATHAALHAWYDPPFNAAVKAIAGVVYAEGTGDPVAHTKALIEAQGAKWGAQAPALPATGNVTAGSLYRFEDSRWSVIQTFSRTTYGAHPSTYPALIRRLRDPYKTEAWRQPIDQYDSFKLVNPFTGKADTALYGGKTWRTKVDNNVWGAGCWKSVGRDRRSRKCRCATRRGMARVACVGRQQREPVPSRREGHVRRQAIGSATRQITIGSRGVYGWTQQP